MFPVMMSLLFVALIGLALTDRRARKLEASYTELSARVAHLDRGQTAIGAAASLQSRKLSGEVSHLHLQVRAQDSHITQLANAVADLELEVRPTIVAAPPVCAENTANVVDSVPVVV